MLCKPAATTNVQDRSSVAVAFYPRIGRKGLMNRSFEYLSARVYSVEFEFDPSHKAISTLSRNLCIKLNC